jgi:predicted methyltransferase
MRMIVRDSRLFAAMLLVVSLCICCAASAADIYDAAVAHAGRTADDRQRDVTDRPADVLRFSGIKPGMQVLDFFAADGYYSEVLSYVAGPRGHVLLLNNTPYDKFAKDAWKDRIARQHLKNVEHITVDPGHMGLKDSSLDAVVMIKVYHDLYWVDPEKSGWPKIDVPSVLDQLASALKPGGLLLVVDHSANPGSGSSVAGTLHRIDEDFMRKDFESHGFKFVNKSDILRRPDDKLDQISFQEPMLGKTDRFVYLFRKGG